MENDTRDDDKRLNECLRVFDMELLLTKQVNFEMSSTATSQERTGLH